MAIEYNENLALFEGNVFEDELPNLRVFLQKYSHSSVSIDLKNCNDMHTAVIQLLLSFKALHECYFIFGDKSKPYAMAIDGFLLEEV